MSSPRSRSRCLACTLLACLTAPIAPGCSSDERGHSRVSVFDGETGEALWQRELRGETLDIDDFSPPGEIAVYTADRCTTDDESYVFDAHTGAKRGEPPMEGFPGPEWLHAERCVERPELGEGLGPVAGQVCLYQSADRLVALELDSEEQRFSAPLRPNDLVPAPFLNEVFVVETKGRGIESGIAGFERLSLETGAVLWRVDSVLDQSPTGVGDGVVYASGLGSELVALALDDGSELWRGERECTFIEAVHDTLVCVEHLQPGTCTYEAD